MRKWLTAFMALLLGFVAVFAAGCGTPKEPPEEVPKGKLYTLQTAYDSGWLTKDDLMSIAYYHNGGRDYNEDIMPEDYAPKPKDPKALSADSPIGKSIRNIVWNDYMSEDDREWFRFKDVGFAYYGSYNGCVAVLTGVDGKGSPDAVFTEEVAGVVIFYSSLPYAGGIQVWKANEEE